MMSELCTLLNALRSYKQSILNNVEKVDQNIMEAVRRFEEIPVKNWSSTKYRLSTQILDALQGYLKILILTDNILQETELKLDNDFTPERCLNRRRSPSSNPFIGPCFDSSTLRPEPNLVDMIVTPETVTETMIDSETDPETFVIVQNNKEECIARFDELEDLNKQEVCDAHCDIIEDLNRVISECKTVKELLNNETSDGLVTCNGTVQTQSLPVKPDVNVNQQISEKSAFESAQDSGLKNALNSHNIVKENSQAVPTIIKAKQAESPALNRNEYVHKGPTVLDKLRAMTIRDRKKELQQKYETPIETNLTWKTVAKHCIVKPEKKTKEKNPILEIEENCLELNQVCNVCHIVNPSEFYVRTEQELFERVEKRLNDDMNEQWIFVVNPYKSKKEAQLILGKFCITYVSNRRKWYRVQVLDWMMSDGKKVLIQLIDYGEKLETVFTNLINMKLFYASFPKFASKCRLTGIGPLGEAKEWSKEAIEALIELSEVTQKKKFSCILMCKEDNFYCVDLAPVEDHEDLTLSQLLIESELVEQKRIAPDPDGEPEFDDEIYDCKDRNKVCEVIVGYEVRDEARICPFTDKSGGCFKGTGCKLEHSKLPEDGVTTDKILNYHHPLAQLYIPVSGSRINIVITGYITTCHFYAQIITNPAKNSSLSLEYENLRTAMKSNVILKYEPLKMLPSVGELVITKHGPDWLRAKCTDVVSEVKVKIFLVDLGVYVIKPLSEIKKIEEEFLHVPFQAVECVLQESREKSDVPVEKSWTFFEKCMKLKTFTAEVISGGEPLGLKIWDDKNNCMDYILRLCFLAEERGNPLFPQGNYPVQVA